MTTRIRPFLMTGTALASAAAIVVAAPTIAPAHDIAIAGAPTPAKLSTAKYELTAITDITLQGISDAYFFGWGGYIGCGEVVDDQCTFVPPDPFYPEFSGDLFSSGVSGVLYYLTDQTLDSIVPNFDLDNYYFEIGTLAGGPNAGYSPWGAVIYVGTNQIFGQGSPIGLATEAIFRNGLTNTFNGLVVALTDPIPVIGNVTSIFYTGFSNNPADTTFYGTGVPGLLAYASTVITGLLPGGVLPFAATKTTATPLAATATKAIEAATEKTSDGVAGSKVTTTEEKTSDVTAETKTDSGKTTDTGKGTESSTETVTSTSADTTGDTTGDTQNKPADTPKETSTDTSGQDSTAGTKGDASETPAAPAKKGTGSSAVPKTGKKADNPLAKIGKRISDALSGGKKAKSSDAGSDTSGGAGGSDSSSSAG